MQDQHAEQIMKLARQLRAEHVQRTPGAVRVEFRGFDRYASELGHASVLVRGEGVHISELRHSTCPQGQRWSSRLAATLQRLDRAARAERLH